MTDSEREESSELHMAGSSIRSGINGFHRHPIELYLIRISPPCRAVWYYMIQHRIPHILIDVDFGKGGEHLPEAFKRQPHQEVPLIIDNDITVFECPAILRYLATNYTDFAGFGISFENRFLCESIISWTNGELHRAVGFNYVYPQFLDKYALATADGNEALVEFGLKQVSRHLEILERRYLDKNRFLTGNYVTVADIFVATMVLQLEWTGTSLKLWPKVQKWMERVKSTEHWNTVHVSHGAYVKELERWNLMH
ncbi:hypothetical protein ACJMK2_009360 [Sinanodonta woodiana]|uniref:Glutathione S-transferase n=1 Tax=Sinanodonta woodiana TaxID=1069815 RepID=A0ABD3VDP9_SINWO